MIPGGYRGVPAHASSSASRSSRAASTAAGAADRSGVAQMKPLVVVGSVNADLVLSVDRLPQPGETLGAKGMSFFPGGKVSGTCSSKQHSHSLSDHYILQASSVNSCCASQ
jgi:hypothetical protein